MQTPIRVAHGARVFDESRVRQKEKQGDALLFLLVDPTRNRLLSRKGEYGWT